MKRMINRKNIKLRKDEAGYALMWVLVVIILAGIILVPLLLLMTSGLHSSAHHEERMHRFYAADAGMEDAAYRIQTNDDGLPQSTGDSWNYMLDEEVNDYQVDVTIENLWVLTGLETDAHGTLPHESLVAVGQIIEFDEEEGTGTYWIDFTYDGSEGEVKVDRVGAWLPAGFSYKNNSSGGITTHEDIPDNPEIIIGSGGTDPVINSTRGGTILRWDFDANIRFEELPLLGGGEPGGEFPIKRTLYFEFTPAADPAGAFSWLRTNRMDIYLSWDTASGTYKVTSTAGETTIETHIARAKLHDRISQVYGDYRAIGQSLMYDASGSWDDWWDSGIRDTIRFGADSLKSKVTDIPDDAEVELAYLYWSAWREDPNDISGYTEEQLAALADEVDRAKFKAPGMASSEWLTADRVQIRPDELTGSPHGWSYSCFADVTHLITGNGNGNYRVKKIDGITDDDTGDHLSYAGWSVMLVYSSAEEQAHQLYLYDDFTRIEGYTTTVLEGIEGFLAPSDSDARLTIFVGEGDDVWNGDKLRFNGHYLPDPPDGINPWNDVMNGRSSGLDGEFIDGVDIDTFDTSLYVDAGDTSAEVKLITDIDHWNLVYVMLSFRTVPSTEPGLYPVNIIGYTYENY